MQGKNKTQVIAEPGKQELFITREFDAPRELVFKAYTDPELFVQWMGPRNYETILDKFEVISGGSYRWISKDGAGNVYAFNGVYHEVTAPERMIGSLAALDPMRTFADIRCPTLVVHSELDPVPVEWAHTLADAIPGADYVLIEGAGHFAHIEDSDKLANAVVPWLTKYAE